MSFSNYTEDAVHKDKNNIGVLARTEKEYRDMIERIMERLVKQNLK